MNCQSSRNAHLFMLCSCVSTDLGLGMCRESVNLNSHSSFATIVTTLCYKQIFLVRNIYVTSFVKGYIYKRKLQSKTEHHFRVLIKYLDEIKKPYYTYQLKSGKVVEVLKGIQSDEYTTEIVLYYKRKRLFRPKFYKYNKQK